MIKKVFFATIAILFLLIPMRVSFAQDDNETPTATPSSSKEDSEEDESIREKIREKVEEIKKNPKACLGTVTDISEDSLQIKNTDEEIQLISITDEVSYAQINDTSKKASFDDIALGDFTVVMGFKSDKILDAKRILITSPVKPPVRKAIFGKITSIVKKELSLSSAGEEFSLTFPKTWKGPEVSELEEGMDVIAVYEPDEDGLIIRTIEIASTPSHTPSPESSNEIE